MATIEVAQFNCDISGEFPIIKASLVARAIRASGADVVGVEEGGGVRQIAQALGWRYYDIRMQIVSRLPLVDPPDGNGLYTYVEVAPGRVAAMENVHLPSAPYGPVWVKHGKTAAQVIAMERRVRLPAIQADLAAARTLHARGIPVFLTGDFNSPSFRDWTKATVGTHRYPLRWAVSAAVEATGFTDSFRAVHPNPVKVAGLTWPTHRTIPGTDRFLGEPKDRIDFVYWQGGEGRRERDRRRAGRGGDLGRRHAVAVRPPPGRVDVPGAGGDAGRARHRPVSARADRRCRARLVPRRRAGRSGRRRTAAWAGGDRGRRAARGRRPRDLRRAVLERWLEGGRLCRRPAGAGRAGAVAVPVLGGGPGAPPVVRATKPVFAVGEPVGVTVKDAPGDRWDWLGIYHRGAKPAGRLLPALALHTHAAVDGTFTLRPSGTFAVPLTPGRYSLDLLRDDLYVKIAGASFAVG